MKGILESQCKRKKNQDKQIHITCEMLLYDYRRASVLA